MTSSVTAHVLEVDRGQIARTRLVDHPVDLGEGQVLLRVDRFAVTANNVTYAVFGDVLGYWDFFPTGDDTFGRVPAMGWATVVESRADAISIGRRFYGWYPMASHVVFTPTATKDGFRDDGAHRHAHAPVYRAYVGTESDPMYDDASDGEDRHALLRGLFLTGFLAEEFFADGGGSGGSYFGAGRVVVLSASSKTAIGFAQRAAMRDGLEVVGVTSSGNTAFVESLGFYDRVVTYDDIASIPTDGGTVSIDMAGDPRSLAAVHGHFADGLAYSMTVGRSHHDAAPEPDTELVGPAPQLFFAPTEVGRRQEEWGREAYARRCADALQGFVDGSRDWLRIETHVGPVDVEGAWIETVAGRVSPDVGLIARFDASMDDT